jgi:uncharacterized protein YndB with AHSA1/START domain
VAVPADDDPIERELYIPAHPETVYRFLVEPDLMERWLGRGLFTTPPREGDLFRLQFTFGEGHIAAGVFTEVSPPHRLAFRFGWEGSQTFPPATSRVEIELRPHEDGTMLRLTHSGFPQVTEPNFGLDDHRKRWSHYLSRLAAMAREDLTPRLP